MSATPNKVVSWVVDAVARRDSFRCIAPIVDRRSGDCHDKWGRIIVRWDQRIDPVKITFAHVKDANAQAMGMRAPSDTGHLLILCWGHHLGTGEKGGYCWGTSRDGLELQRKYLAQFNPALRSGL